MGVEGTAIASLLAQGIAGILCFVYTVKKYFCFEMALKKQSLTKVWQSKSVRYVYQWDFSIRLFTHRQVFYSG